MKKFIKEFLTRGLMAASGGPVVLAIIYGILGATGTVEALAPGQVCLSVLTITLMAFVAAGITCVYNQERLPLFPAILIHGITLYLDYILIYLVNGWLKQQLLPVLIFTAIFFGGFALVWLIIFLTTRNHTRSLNAHIEIDNG